MGEITNIAMRTQKSKYLKLISFNLKGKITNSGMKSIIISGLILKVVPRKRVVNI